MFPINNNNLSPFADRHSSWHGYHRFRHNSRGQLSVYETELLNTLKPVLSQRENATKKKWEPGEETLKLISTDMHGHLYRQVLRFPGTIHRDFRLTH